MAPAPAPPTRSDYAFLDSAITKDLDPTLVGRRTPNAAPHKVGLFTRIDLPRGAAVGGSLESVAEREHTSRARLARHRSR